MGKDDGVNLKNLEGALQDVVMSNVLGLNWPYSRACFGHHMSLVCEYATNHDKIFVSMKKISLKQAQANLEKTITWMKKKLGRVRQEWKKASIEVGLLIKKLKTQVKTQFAIKIALFREILEYTIAINLYYQRQTMKLQT